MSARTRAGNKFGSLVGSFSYTIAENHWSWSDELYQIHGYAPHTVPATTETLLRHHHPDDAARASHVLETAMRDGRPFSSYHRIIDSARRVRSVVTVGQGVADEDGHIEQLVGFVADLTEARRNETQVDVEVALVRIGEHRAVIEQAKGMLMLATGCDAEEAFRLLRDTSSVANIKLNAVALRLVEQVGARLRPNRGSCDEVMGFLEQLDDRGDHLRWSDTAV